MLVRFAIGTVQLISRVAQLGPSITPGYRVVGVGPAAADHCRQKSSSHRGTGLGVRPAFGAVLSAFRPIE